MEVLTAQVNYEAKCIELADLPSKLMTNIITTDQARTTLNELHTAENQWTENANLFYHTRPTRNNLFEYEGFIYLVARELAVDRTLRYTDLIQACEANQTDLHDKIHLRGYL